MDETLANFHNLVVTANLLRLTPGIETSASLHLKELLPDHYLFKFLGSYDLLSLELSKGLSTLDSNPRIDGVLEASSISVSPLPLAQGETEGQFTEKYNAICGYPILAMVFIQLNPGNGYAVRLDKQKEIVASADKYLNSKEIDFCMAGLLPYGKDDLCLLLGTTTFSSIFELVNYVREECGGIVIDSTTFTTIAFHLVNDREALLKLDEHVSVEVLASCEPGGEKNIASHFSPEKFSFKNILGKDDIRITSKGLITAGEAIAAVLDSRSGEDAVDSALLSTTTYIESDINISLCGGADYKSKFPSSPQRELQQRITSECLHKLDQLSKCISVDQYFVQKCQETVTKLSSSALIEASCHLTSDFIICLQHQLSQILDELISEIESGEGILTTEKTFQFLTTNFANALAQRTINLHDYRHGLPDLPKQFGQGAYLVSEAITKLIRQIYEIMERDKVGTGEWEGFVFFSQFHGFKCFTSSVFSLPSNSLSSIIDPALNWLTLSHEICHDIWAEQDVFNTPRAWVVGGVNASFKDILDGKASDKGVASPDTKFSMVAEPMLGEWYAHWFDFRHFYSSDFEFFTWSIWSSWLRLPLVQNNICEYFHRSLAVYVAYKLDAYLENNLSREDTIELTETLFDELLEILVEVKPEGFENKHYSLIQEERAEISSWVGSNIGFILQFEESCIKPKFAERMEHDITSSLELLPKLAEGEAVSGSDNIFSLLIASMKWIYLSEQGEDGKKDVSHKFGLALLMSCLFANTDYEDRNSN